MIEIFVCLVLVIMKFSNTSTDNIYLGLQFFVVSHNPALILFKDKRLVICISRHHFITFNGSYSSYYITFWVLRILKNYYISNINIPVKKQKRQPQKKYEKMYNKSRFISNGYSRKSRSGYRSNVKVHQ